MSELALQGRVFAIGETQTFGEKGFRKRELVLETDLETNYPQKILLEATQDNVALLDKISVGEYIKAHINLRGRAWLNPKDNKVKYFNSIVIWRIETQQAPKVNPEDLSEPPF